jgi:hypothetical protein
VIDHFLMRWGAVRHRPGAEIVLLGEEFDARRLTINVDRIADVQAVMRFSGGRLSELASDLCEIDRQALHVDRGLLRERRVGGAEKKQPDERDLPEFHGSSDPIAIPTDFPSIPRTRPSE